MAKRVFVVVAALFALAFLPSQSVHSAVIFSDDFESYALNSYPSPPWINMFSGVSGYVTNVQAYSGVQSFRSESSFNWARWDYVPLTIPDQVSYHAAVYLTEVGKGCAVGFGFVEPGAPSTGRWANAVYFGNDGHIYFSTRTAGSPVLANWSPNVWYEVDVDIDYVNLIADVYIDGVQYADDIPTDPKTLPASVYGVPVPLDQYGMFGQNFPAGVSSIIFYDDMTVTTDLPVPVEETSWGRIKSMFDK